MVPQATHSLTATAQDEALVGLVSRVSEESNSGDGHTLQAIPSTFVHAALTQWHAGVAIGPATLPLALQLATNPAMREFLLAGAEPGGVLVVGSVGEHYPLQVRGILGRAACGRVCTSSQET